ncbi:hypothetical protein ONZ45_g8347 [Pleurotus djamor]|nr:hypothetical protein ONZ45_g8347 [Pleurotus djamor]
MHPSVPLTRELSDPPGVCHSVVASPVRHATPLYVVAWRVTLAELLDCFSKYDPECNKETLMRFNGMQKFIKKQWREQGYMARFGLWGMPSVLKIPRRGKVPQEVFLPIFSNASASLLNKSQAENAPELLAAARDVLHLTEGANQTLKWHSIGPIEPYKPRVK